MITTASNLPKAISQRKVPAVQINSSLRFDNLLENILAFDFSSVPSLVNQGINPLIQYLRDGGFVSFAHFLELSEK